MSTFVECVTGNGYLCFPRDCLRCGRQPQTILTIDAGRNLDLVVFSDGTNVELTAPVCRRCWALRRIVGFLWGLIVLFIGIGGSIVFIAHAPDEFRLLCVAIGMLIFGLTIVYIRNWHSRWMDRLTAGVAAGRLRRDGTFRLWLRRAEVADELSYELQPRKYVSSASYATHEERTFQQLDSWWGKCLLGAVALFAAWVCWRELTILEQGRQAAIAMPAALVALSELVGKWPVVGLFALPGCLLVGIGLWQWIGRQAFEDSDFR